MRPKFLILFFLFASSTDAQTIAIRAGHLVNPANGTVSEHQVILITDGKIKEIGADIEIPSDAQIIDLSNEWISPGLMDAHTHLALTAMPGGAPFESFYLKESTAFRGFRALKNAQDLVHAGFTTIRDVGNDANYAVEDLRRAIAAGWFDGPTILSSGKIIAPFGGQSNAIPAEQGPFWRFEYIDADNPEEVRKAVRENIYYGVDVIKLVADNNPYFYSLEEIRAAVDEAHKAGRSVAVHVIGGDAATNVIEAGVDSLEHGFYLTDAQLQRMKDKNIVLVGTDMPKSHLQALGGAGASADPPDILAAKIIDRLQRARRIGVKMAFGTDSILEMPNRKRPDLMLDYLEVWREAGIPPAEILRSMTTNAAELLRVDGARGTIASGFAADIVATPENPLANIEALRKINFIMKDGKVLGRSN
jgi:imidazolonepropionase-like amidohydrolase